MEPTDQQVCELARTFKRAKEAVAMAFGDRAASDPLVVAEFLKADAVCQLAIQVKGLREIIESGTGAITIGIEKSNE